MYFIELLLIDSKLTRIAPQSEVKRAPPHIGGHIAKLLHLIKYTPLLLRIGNKNSLPHLIVNRKQKRGALMPQAVHFVK